MLGQTAEPGRNYKEGLEGEMAPVRGLRKINVAMAFFHLFQGVVLLFVSTNFSLPVMSYFLEMDTVTNKLNPIPNVMFHLRLAPLVAGFLLITAISHAALSTPWVYHCRRSAIIGHF
jgi:hypothetical protein